MKRDDKKGVSGIIAAIIMIGIVLAAGVIVWSVVNNIVNQSLGSAESCFGNYGKISLNNRYTCYNKSGNETLFSVNIGDVNVDSVVVRISSPEGALSYTIEKGDNTITNLQSYNRSSVVQLPGENSGLTYRAINMPAYPDLIDISPVINGKQCDVSDSIKQIDLCSSLAS
jgi:flagellin-like protein